MQEYTMVNNFTNDVITAIIQRFMTSDVPKFNQRYNYYIGKQKITKKQPTDAGKPCNRVVANFVRNIVDTYEGYAIGVPVNYSNEDVDITDIIDTLNYNDVNCEDSELFRDALIFGRGVEINFIDEEGKQRFTTLDPRTCIPVYDNTLERNLKLVIRFYQVELNGSATETNYYVDVYDEAKVYHYSASPGFASISFIDDEPNYFNQIPFTFFDLNKESEAIAEQVFSLQDAYNTLISDSLDDWDAFVDAYLVLKGVIADEDDLVSMKENRCLMMDNDADAQFLTKDVNTAEIENLLKTTEQKIRELSGCPNFASEEFSTSSGIAIRFRCMQLENNVATIMNRFKKALQKRIELICSIITLKGEEGWRDINIEFTRNLPNSLVPTTPEEINAYRGLVPDRALLEQLPFIKDVDKAIEEIKAQNKDSLDLFHMSGGAKDEQLLER